jgi:hypothetical protein
MELCHYFKIDDGSLPEIEVAFGDSAQLVEALELLTSCSRTVFAGNNGAIWSVASDMEVPYSGPADALLVVTGAVCSFHLVFEDLCYRGRVIPDLGSLVDPNGLVLNYRMGSVWTDGLIHAFVALLAALCTLGGILSTPWWGHDAERSFLHAVRCA